MSVYAGDVLAFDRWTFDLGLRVDRQRARNRPSKAPANGLAPSILPALNYPGGAFHEWTDVSPRLGATVRLTDTTLLRASYARYPSQLGSNVVTFENAAQVGRIQYRFADANGDRLAQASELLGPTGSVDGRESRGSRRPVRAQPRRSGAQLAGAARLRRRHRTGDPPGFSLALNAGQSIVTNAHLVAVHRTDPRRLRRVPHRRHGHGGVRHAGVSAGAGRIAAAGIGPLALQSRRLSPPLLERRPRRHSPPRRRLDAARVRHQAAASRALHGEASMQDPTPRFDVPPPSVSGFVDGGLAVAPGEFVIHAKWIYSVAGLYELPWQMSVSGTLYGRQGYPTAEIITVNRPDGLGLTQVLRDRDLDAGRFPDSARCWTCACRSGVDRPGAGDAGSRRVQHPEPRQHAAPGRRGHVPNFRNPLEIVAPRLVRLGLQLQF